MKTFTSNSVVNKSTKRAVCELDMMDIGKHIFARFNHDCERKTEEMNEIEKKEKCIKNKLVYDQFILRLTFSKPFQSLAVY